MSESKTNIGWILCPSQSCPGKYYYNVQTRKAARTLDETDNNLSVLTITETPHAFFKPKTLLEDKSDGYPETTTVPEDKSYGYPKPNTLPENKSHGYSEPTTLSDRSTITPNYVYTYTKKLDIFLNVPWTQQPPTVAQTAFPTYVMDTTLPDFVRTNKNDKTLFLCLDGRQKTVEPFSKFETSTPNNLFLESISESQNNSPEPLIEEPVSISEPTPVWKFQPKLPTPYIHDAFMSNEKPIINQSNKFEIYNSKNCVSEYILESQSFRPESLNKESVLKLEPKPVWKLEPKLSEKPIISLGSKVGRMKSTKEFPESKRIHILQDIDLASTDLRFRLLAKRKFKGVTDTAVKRPFIQNNRVPVQRVQDALHTSRDAIAPSVAQHFATAPRNSVEPFTWTGIVPDLPTCMPYKNYPKC